MVLHLFAQIDEAGAVTPDTNHQILVLLRIPLGFPEQFRVVNGDIQFQQKSGAKMREIIADKNRTVVIVSHSTSTLLELCDEILWLHDGEIKELGDPKTVINNYSAFMRNLK